MLETDTLSQASNSIALLEHGENGHLFSSYRSAVASVLELVEYNSHVVAYVDRGGVGYHIFENVRRRTAGLKFTYIDKSDPETILNAFSDDTALIWAESIRAPYLQIPDLESVARIAKEKGAVCICDNSLATPYVLQPLKFDFDIVLGNGQSLCVGLDVREFGYAVVAKDREFLSDKLNFLINTLGSKVGEGGGTLIEVALEDFDKRMAAICTNMNELIEFLKSNNNIEAVYLPSVEKQGETRVAKDSLERTSGVISFQMTGDMERALNFKQKLILLDECRNGKSFPRKILHPASDLYGSVPAEVRDGLNIPDGLFQLMAGSWNIKELLDDLTQAFK
ncbi:MAG: PLP-dependent transferase [Pseudomonadota bacterium]|nr:PLP-dependent transferase [Pseudomonadota bacterium]